MFHFLYSHFEWEMKQAIGNHLELSKRGNKFILNIVIPIKKIFML